MSEETKEVHIKTYDEWLKYYKNATKEQVIEDLTQDVKYFADAVKDIKELQDKLQQKENQLKEVRKDLDKQITFCTNEADGTTNDKICRITIQYLKHLKQELEELWGGNNEI